MANKISLNIAGFNLIINTQEDEAQVRRLNEMLNSDLKQILTQNPSASVTNAALLCALDYLDRYDKATNNANNMRDQIKDYMSDASNAKLQYDDEVRKNADLSAEIDDLKARIARLASEGAAGSAVEQSLRTELESVRSELNNVRAQLNEQVEKNTSILSDFSILNNALKNKDNEIANLNDQITRVNGELTESKQRNVLLEASVNDARSEIASLTAKLEEAGRNTEELLSKITAQNNTVPGAPETETITKESYSEPTRPDPVPFSFSDSTGIDESMTEDIDEYEDAPEYYDDQYPESLEIEESEDVYEEDVTEDLPVQNEPVQPLPERSIPKKDYRFFDYEDGAIENEDGEVGVGDGFKTFGQMIAEEKRQPGNSFEDANSGKLDDELPNLSWIDDIE